MVSHPALFIVLAWGCGLLVGLVAGINAGKRAGVQGMDDRLVRDREYRQHVLERLARLEGARLEVSE